LAKKNHPPFLAQDFYPGVFYFENKTLQDKKFGPKMEDEIFLPKN